MTTEPHRLRTALRAVMFLAALAIIGAACGSDPAAVTVNATELSRDQLFELTSARDENVSDDDPTASAETIASAATDWIVFESVGQYLEDLGEGATDADRQDAREGLEAQRADFEAQGVTLEEVGAQVLDDLDGPEGQRLIDRQAVITAATRYVQGRLEPTDPPVVYCSAHILVETEDEAVEIVGLLDGGEDFATLASDRSIDPGSGAQGGDLGCVGLGQFVPEFEQAALEAGPGDLVGPVESEFGFHIIVVRSVGPATPENHPADVAGIAGFVDNSEDVNAGLNELATTAMSEADVDVDPSVGVWDPDALQVVPGAVADADADVDPDVDPDADAG